MLQAIKKIVGVFLAVAFSVTLVSTAVAQEGHPIKGSWIGVWEGNAALGDNVLLVLNWDGEKISGVINPGTDNLAVSSASLNPDDWSITIEAGTYKIAGKFERLELPNRAIVGTWSNGGNTGKFEIVRQ